ncbi:protein LAZ1, partial [Tanacetum coccineum]
AMHVKLVHKDSKQMIFVLFIYAANLPTDRRTLWSDLGAHKQVVRNLPWVLMGDFNVALNLEDYHSGPSVMSPPMIEFSIGGLSFSSFNRKRRLIAEAFVLHYEKFLGCSMDYDNINSNELFLKKVSNVANSNMVHPISDEEIKRAMFDIGNDKAPRPDRYTSAFFKKVRDIVGIEVCAVVRDFFINGQILKEINHIFLALIPKIPTPIKITDYWLISCCNVIYKCISKIITNRIIEGVKDVVSVNQSTFISGRNISDNILITQELMHNYHCKIGPPRCAFKVDIQKAYDTVDWRFLGRILKEFGFHRTMIKWTMDCVTSTSFSISLNGDVHGFFKGKRGLRQGDCNTPKNTTMQRNTTWGATS